MFYSEPENGEDGKGLAAFQSLLILLCLFALIFWFGVKTEFDDFNPTPPLSIKVSLIPEPNFVKPKPPPPPEIPEPIIEKNNLAEIIRQQAQEKKEEKKRQEEEEQKKRDEEEQKRQEEEEEKKREEEEQKKRDEDEKKRQEEEQNRLREEEGRQKALANRLNRMEQRYSSLIRSKIRPYLRTPLSVPNDADIISIIQVRLSPDGSFLSLPELIKSSGYPEYDEAALQAVLQSAPLPVPNDAFVLENFKFMNRFTNLTLEISPHL